MSPLLFKERFFTYSSLDMSSEKCKLMETTNNKRDLIEITRLIDLTDKPIGLTRDEIGWSKVRSNASNCICCCSNNSITLVTTDDSYILDHVPLDNIQFAQTNASLKYLALSNHRKIAIIDLVENNINDCRPGNTRNANSHSQGETKVVNLAAHRLTMNDVIFWRWLDNTNLAILSYGALFTCSVEQQHINHPAYTALHNRSRYLTMHKVYDSHEYLSALCQVTDIHRDLSGNIYAISSLYSTNSLLRNQNILNSASSSAVTQQQSYQSTNPRTSSSTQRQGSPLKSSFGSMPSKLSQLSRNDRSFDSLKQEYLLTDPRRPQSPVTNGNVNDEICGLVQVYCKTRDRAQLIQAHAITFTNPPSPYSGKHQQPKTRSQNSESISSQKTHNSTILVAANKIGNQMRVHFIEMATSSNYPLSGSQNASPTALFKRLSDKDFPTSIVCSHVGGSKSSDGLHVAMITTKHGQLFVCSVAHSTILFDTSITSDIISSTVLETKTQGLMVICRNGQILLVKLILARLMKLLDESKTLRHISSSHNLLPSEHILDSVEACPPNLTTSERSKASVDNHLSASLDTGLEVLISTKL